ncbi:MAG: hypothetical protein ACYDAG_18855 [Chloroflexota bacterium]
MSLRSTGARRFAFFRRPLPAIPIAAALLLAISLFTSPMQSLAAQFLTIFRVQDFAVINMPQGSGGNFGYGTVPNLTKFGDMAGNMTRPQPAPVTSLAAASSAVGFAVATPSSLPNKLPAQPSSIRVSPGQTVGFTFRAAKAKAYLASIGESNFSLPPKFDGASLQLHIQPAVVLAYGAIPSASPAASPRASGRSGEAARGKAFFSSGGIVLAETKAPSLDSSGVSSDDMRNFLLSLPGLPPQTRAELSAIGNWQNTLPIPVPPGVTASKTRVNGSPAVLYGDPHNAIANGIVWQSNGIIYGAAGSLSQPQLVTLAGSVK